MIKKVLILKAKTVMVDGKERSISRSRRYFIEDISKDYHSADGIFKKEDLNKVGNITSSSNITFQIFDASFIDSYKGIKKLAQTIPLKDLGYILAETGIGKNSIIVDTGAGSGGSACFFARFVKKVYTYDIEEKNLEVTRQNAEYFGLKNIVFKKVDAYESIPNKNVDMILLDLPDAKRALPNAIKALKPGGFIVAYCPQITQAQEFVNAARELLYIKSVEINERDWKIDGQIVKPISLSNIHSGFITIMRKV